MDAPPTDGSPSPAAAYEDNCITVCVRARPLNAMEQRSQSGLCLRFMDGKSLVIFENGIPSNDGGGGGMDDRSHSFSFDHAYDPNVPQDQVYEDLGRPVLLSSFGGFNTCIFAYGQTGSGKSYCMMGPNGGRDLQVSPGIIPRLCEQLFKEAHRRQQEASAAIAREAAAGAEPHALPPELEVHVYISYLEIYREKVRCLLRKDGSEESLKVRQHPVLGVYVEGLTEVPVTTVDHITQLMAMGNESRHIASTKMNDSSSRSHAIFAIQLVQKRKSTLKDGSAKITELRAKINLVDLAGSERAKSTGAEGDTLREGALINRSLTTLGLVISALADASKAAANPSTSGAQAKAKHVPYRDSTLTFLLKESLGGNSKTFMLSTLSPALINYEETLSTLRYADRAKAIMTRAFVNESAGDKRIRELEDEVTKLREQLRHVAETAQASPNSHAARERLVGDDEAMDDHHGDDDDDNAAPANGGVDALKEELRLAEEIIKQLSATDADRARAAGIGFTDGAQSSAVRLDRKDPYLLNMDGAGDWVYAHVAPGQRLFVGAPSSFVADDIDLDSCDSSLALSSEGDGADHTRGDGEAVGMVTVAGEKHIIIPFELCEGIGAPHCSINVLQDGTARLCPEAGCDTYLNDSSSPVREEVAIRSGDLIFIGAEELQFRFMNPAEPPMTARGRRAVTQAAAAAAASASGAEAGNNVVPPSRLPLLSQPKRGAEPPSAPTAAAVVPRLSMPSTTGPAAHVDPTTSAIPSLNLTSLGSAAAKAAHPAAPSIPPPALSLAPPAPAAAGPTGAKCFSRAPVAASASSTADSDPFNPAGFTPASSTFFKEERERVCRHTFLFLGPEQSGKTAIRQNLPQEDRSWFNSFFSKDQNRTHLPTWGVDRSTITVQGLEEVQLYLVELGGSCFSMMQDQLPSRRVTYVLCFSLATQPTIDTFRQTLELILYQADRSEVPVVLMGTHADQSCLKDRELHDVMDEFGQEVQRFFQMLQPNPALRPHIIGRFAINNQSRTVQGTGLGRIQSFPDLLLWLGEHALTQAKSDEDFPNALVPRRCMALYNAVRALKNTANWCLSAAEYKALAKNVDARYGLAQNDLNAHTQLLDSWGLLKHRFRHTVLRRAVVVHVRWFMDVLASVCCATLASTNDSNNLLFLDALRTYGKNMPFPPESLTRADAHSLLSRGIITTKVLAVIVSCTLRRGAAQPPSASFLAERVRQVFDLLQRCDIAIAGSRLHLHHKASNGGPTTSTTTTTGTIATPLATSATSPFEGFLLLPFKLTAPPPPAIAMYLPQLLTGPFYRFNFNMTPPHFFAKVVARATAVVGEVYLGPAHPWKVPRDRSFFPLCVRPPQPSSHTTHTLNHNAAPSAEAAMTPPPDAVVLPAVDSPLWGSTAWLMGSDGSRALLRMLPHSLYISFHSSTPSEEMVEQQPNIISTDLFTSVLEVVRGVLGESPGARGEESVLCAPAGAEGPSRGRFDGDLLHDDNNVVVVATAEPPRTQPPRMFYRLLTENMNNAERNSERERVALLSARGSRTSMDHTNPTAAELSGFYTQSTTEPIKAEALVAVLEASFTTSKVVSEDVLQAAEAWNVAAQSPSATPARKGAAMDALVAALSLV